MDVESTLKRASRWAAENGALLVTPVALLALFAALAFGPATPPDETPEAIRREIAAGPPKVEPVKLLEVTREDAEAINAKVPYSTAPVVAAKPFHFGARTENYQRARDCLASAVYYEAGDDAVGEKSVAQVVLNRVRHPAFPGSVCGVVYQGQERTTGCQFSFTCDGSMARRTPSESAWSRAKKIAEMALDGTVDKTVGLATHYHTDWVVPYWSSSLDKISKVRTHLFFRFKGYWGKAAAMRRGGGGAEPQIAKLASLSTVHGPVLPQGASGEEGPQTATFVIERKTDADIEALVNKLQTQGAKPTTDPYGRQTATFTVKIRPKQEKVMMGGTDLKGNSMAVADPDRGLYGLKLDLNRFPGSYTLVARSLCGTKKSCTVYGWRRDAAPQSISDFQAKRGKALFVYKKEGGERSEWDCREFPGQEPLCIAGTNTPG